MELLVNPTSYSNALELIKLGVHQICVGTKEFSLRNNCLLTIKQIEELIKNKKQTKILILVNRLYFDPELPELAKYILAISKLNIDGIIFSDFGINQICFENNLKVNLIYNPETLVTNFGQFDFYKENNIGEVALARELNVNQIKEIASNKKDMKIQVQVGGHALMMHSR
jgi:putative protease